MKIKDAKKSYRRNNLSIVGYIALIAVALGVSVSYPFVVPAFGAYLHATAEEIAATLVFAKILGWVVCPLLFAIIIPLEIIFGSKHYDKKSKQLEAIADKVSAGIATEKEKKLYQKCVKEADKNFPVWLDKIHSAYAHKENWDNNKSKIISVYHSNKNVEDSNHEEYWSCKDEQRLNSCEKFSRTLNESVDQDVADIEAGKIGSSKIGICVGNLNADGSFKDGESTFVTIYNRRQGEELKNFVSECEQEMCSKYDVDTHSAEELHLSGDKEEIKSAENVVEVHSKDKEQNK